LGDESDYPHPGTYFEQWLLQAQETATFLEDRATKPHSGFTSPDPYGKGQAGQLAPGKLLKANQRPY